MQATQRKSIRRSTQLITLGSCLYILYESCVRSPVATDFFRAIGATPFHIGLLGGVPTILTFMFFVGALLVNRLERRKPLFMILFISARLLYIPVAFLPLMFPNVGTDWLMGMIIVLFGVHFAMTNVGETLFLSWVADLIPHRILNRYWGGRRRWMSWMTAGCLWAVAAFVAGTNGPMTVNVPLWPGVCKTLDLGFLPAIDVVKKFQILVCLGVVAGVTDILLFIRVHEPKHLPVRNRHVLHVLLEPILDRGYRSFLIYKCIWGVSTIIVYAFATFYLLDQLQTPVTTVLLLSSLHMVGLAISSGRWGRLADQHGHKPVLVVCLMFKPLYALAFVLVRPETVLWILTPVYIMDGLVNGGLFVAENGYSMKRAPRENRSMFLATVGGLTGICGGLAAIGVGKFIDMHANCSWEGVGVQWNTYQVVFCVSFFMRAGCAVLVHIIHEPDSSPPSRVVRDIFSFRPWRLPMSAQTEDMD